MNPLQLSARYLQGYGARSGVQEAVDYGLGAAIGAGGQQVMNWATGGADPNPLLSGALFAPVGAAAVRGGRLLNQSLSPKLYDANPKAIEKLIAPNGNRLFDSIPFMDKFVGTSNPNLYSQAALIGSLAGMAGGAGTSVYNTFAGGADIDNNTVAGGLALLGGLAPITYSMVRNHMKRGDEIRDMPEVNVRFPRGASVGTSQPFDLSNAPGYSGETARQDNLLDRLFNRSKSPKDPIF